MGASTSVQGRSFLKRKKSLGVWTNDEKKENEEGLIVLKTGAEFIAEHFFYGVPVVTSRKSVDPLSPVWISPDTSKVLQRVAAHEGEDLEKDWVFG
jgi:hypothetical protein